MVDILKEIREFEQEENIKIIFAAESGARCWGLDSPTSDYDIRFIFHHPIREYLKIDKVRPSFEIKEDAFNIDFMGFDIYKFIGLIRKTNVNMLEMLNSPIIYYDDKSKLMQAIRETGVTAFNPIVAYYHYHALGWNNYNKYIIKGLEKGKSLPKVYVYALRGLLGALHVLDTGNILPPDFEKTLSNTTMIPEEIKKIYIEEFIPMKRGEIEIINERNPLVDEYLEMEFLKRKELNKQAKVERIKKRPVVKNMDTLISDMLLNDLFDSLV